MHVCSISSDVIVQGVKGVLDYKAGEKKRPCDDSSIDGLETRARYQGTVYRERKKRRRISRHESSFSKTLSLPTNVSPEERRLDPIHTD